MKIKTRYEQNKAAKVGTTCICPSCNTQFVKLNYQQAFCKSKIGTQCKDKYWNTITPTKRNNTSRISPANKAYQEQQMEIRGSIRHKYTSEGYKIIHGVAHDEWGEPVYNVDEMNDTHPFSSDAFLK